MSLSDSLSFFTMHFYALGTIALISGALSRKTWITKGAFFLIGFGLLMHTVFIALVWETKNTITQPMYLFILAWLILVVSLLIWSKWKYNALLLPIVPLALFLCIIALILRHGDNPIPDEFTGITFLFHIIAIFLSFGIITVGFGAGILFLIQENTIKKKSPVLGFKKDIPALAILDKANALSVVIGFPLFSIGILFGLLSARFTWGNIFIYDPKEIVSIIVWGIYAWLFYQRFTNGWQGKKPAILAILIFSICIFSLIVVNFFTKSYHNFLV